MRNYLMAIPARHEETTVGKKRPTTDRAAKVAAMQAEQRRKDRRSKILIYGTTAVIVGGLVTAIAIPVVNESRKQATVAAIADAPIAGVTEFTDLSREHTDAEVQYATTPPAGGDHRPAWQNCGVYTEPIEDENAVHSLEHGSVWITYDPSLAADDVATLAGKASNEGYVLVSPYEGQDSPVILTAWGHQLKLDSADDQRVDAFLKRYLQGEQTPEPGAVCYGGVGTPAA